jgi:hypothetical protein
MKRKNVFIAAAVLLTAIILSGAYAFLSDFKAKRDLTAMADRPEIRGFAEKFFGSYNGKRFGYMYDSLVSKNVKSRYPKEVFVSEMAGIFEITGKVRDVRLVEYSVKGKSSYVDKDKKSASYRLSYYMKCDTADSVCLISISLRGDAWYLTDFKVNPGVTDEDREKVYRYTESQRQLAL